MENAVPAAGKLGGDGLHRVELAVAVDDEVRLVDAEDDRFSMSEASDELLNTTGHSSPKVMSANGISHRTTRPTATS
jgi:hypothetical protein